MSLSPTSPLPHARTRVVLAVSRGQEVRLLTALPADQRLRLAARVSSAAELLPSVEQAQADVAILDEDLHALDQELLRQLERHRFPFVFVARDPEGLGWPVAGGLVVPASSEPAAILDALPRAMRGEHRPRRAPSAQAPRPPTRQPAAEPPETTDDPPRARRRFQVPAFWGGASAGRTLLSLSTGALLGTVARTIVVDLDTTGASLASYLENGTRGLIDRHIVSLANAAPTTHEAWQRELQLVVQPLGPYSRHAHILCGVPLPRQRSALSGAFVERLIAELRTYDYVLLDLADEPLTGLGVEVAVGSAVLRLADHILVVATPDPVCLHRTRTAVSEAADVLVRQRASLVLNRHGHQDTEPVELATELPVVATLPDDAGPVRRALERGRPVVCEPDSRLRRPLGELVERIHGGKVDLWPVPDRPSAGPVWTRVRTAVGAALPLGSLLGGGPR